MLESGFPKPHLTMCVVPHSTLLVMPLPFRLRMGMATGAVAMEAFPAGAGGGLRPQEGARGARPARLQLITKVVMPAAISAAAHTRSRLSQARRRIARPTFS